MVFENLTLFEIHLEDADFGPCGAEGAQADVGGEQSGDETPENADAGDEGPPVGRLILASVVVSIVVALLARKLAGDDDEPDVAIDAPEEPDGVALDDE